MSSISRPTPVVELGSMHRQKDTTVKGLPEKEKGADGPSAISESNQVGSRRPDQIQSQGLGLPPSWPL
jgi:hypothetical protein